MNSAADSVTITLLGKQYQIACPPDQRDELLESARLLNNAMDDVRKTGVIIGLERIAIISALNISHDLIQAQKTSSANQLVTQGIDRLTGKVDEAIRQLAPTADPLV